MAQDRTFATIVSGTIFPMMNEVRTETSFSPPTISVDSIQYTLVRLYAISTDNTHRYERAEIGE